MSSWSSGRTYLNFAERTTDARTAYAEDTYARLREVKSQVDPGDPFRANHPIPVG